MTADQPSPSPVDTSGPIPDTWTAISAGNMSTCATAAGGGVRCWGNDAGPADHTLTFGAAGDLPMSWR